MFSAYCFYQVRGGCGLHCHLSIRRLRAQQLVCLASSFHHYQTSHSLVCSLVSRHHSPRKYPARMQHGCDLRVELPNETNRIQIRIQNVNQTQCRCSHRSFADGEKVSRRSVQLWAGLLGHEALLWESAPIRPLLACHGTVYELLEVSNQMSKQFPEWEA